MTSAILTTVGLKKRFGALPVTNDVTLDIKRHEIHALIGPNGAGKTTFINLLHGALSADAGLIYLDGVNITKEPVHRRSNLGMARSFQISQVIPDFTAFQNVALAVQACLGSSFGMWTSAGSDASIETPAMEMLEVVGLRERSITPAIEMSHGERRQLEIAIALASKPKLMLLDEPMAGMGKKESLALVQLLKNLKGKYSILMVEHDMDAVFSLADRVSVLVRGCLIKTGTPSEVRNDRDVQAAYLGHSE